MSAPPADVCFLLEGTYPYVAGGVSSWVHDLITNLDDLSFAVVAILPNPGDHPFRYPRPANLVEIRHVYLNALRPGRPAGWGGQALLARLEEPLKRMVRQGGLDPLRELTALLRQHDLGARLLLESRPGWELMVRAYQELLAHSSFNDFFWSWRTLVGSLGAVLTAELPPARVYHAVSTGYAGLLAARARLEQQRPALLTEHGIYTNERRIEITMAEWLYEDPTRGWNIEGHRKDLKDLWMEAFAGYSRACYEACDQIITLYGGNQEMQRRDGAPADKQRIIPNGIDYQRYSQVQPVTEPRPPTVALIGRVVPIKDVKSFIRAVGLLARRLPEVTALIMGPTEEDEGYFHECQKLVEMLGLEEQVRFLGRVNIAQYLGRLDLVVLSSISEAQPLVILEAGAAGIPSVTTNVGACAEMLFGQPNEHPPLGQGGEIAPVANPAALAESMARLLLDPQHRQACGQALRERVRTSYNKEQVNRWYRELYEACAALPDGQYLAPDFGRSDGKG